MNRSIFPLIIIILFCSLYHSSAMAVHFEDNQDSLRFEVQKLIDKAGRLINIHIAGGVDSAKYVLDSTLGIIHTNFGSYDTLLAKAYYCLSLYHYFKNSNYDLSIEYALKILNTLELSPDENHILALNSYNMLVTNCLQKHDLVRCEQYSNQRFEILNNLKKPLTPKEAELMVDAYNDRARLLVQQNKYDEAINDLEYGLSIITDEMKGGARLRADLNGNIAWILAKQGKLVESESRLLEVLEMVKQAYHPKHKSVIYTIHLLGMNARNQGNYVRADSLMDIELAMIEEIHGESNRMLSDIFQEKSLLLLAFDNPEEAVEIAMRAVDVNKKYTKDYPTYKLMGSLENAGNVAMATGRWKLANEMFEELLSHKHSFLNTVFGYASESQKLDYLSKYPPIINTLLSGAIESSKKELHRTAMNMILRGKGMAIDGIAAEHAAAICSSDPFLDSLIEERRNVCSEIADLFLSSISEEENVLRLISELYTKKNDIETELSLHCSRMQLDYDNSDVTAETVASKMPKQSVLWEFIKYDRVNLDRLYEHDTTLNQSYLVMVLTPDADIKVVDLGDALPIDSLIVQYQDILSDALKAHLSDNLSILIERYLKTAAGLYEHIVAPLEFSSQDRQMIFVAADGLLNLIPFETLTRNGGRYLIEDHQFVYLTSGRDVLRDKPDLSGPDVFVMADPDFMIDTKELPGSAASQSSPLFAFRGDSAITECLESMFSPLPMTKQEGMSVAGLLGETGRYDITYLESNRACESALKNLSQPPDILHIATHGYFCQQAENTYLSNPLLRSGLILAGANRTIGGMNDRNNSHEDGILTAMEVSGLNLIGTDLVVLSACLTGMGEVRSGEGVFGLRRAFQHAGVKSVIMSMFAVPDESTFDFMEQFYSNWLSGQPKGSAMRNASLSIIKRLREKKGFAHPLFWGGFILVGDPN